MLPGGTRILYIVPHMVPGLRLVYAEPAQPPTTAGEELDDLSVDDLSVHGPSDVCILS